MSDADIFGIGFLVPVFDIGTGKRREPVQLLHRGCGRELQRSLKTSARDFRKGKIDEAAVKASTERYEDAIVNYYLGLRAYRDRLSAVPKK